MIDVYLGKEGRKEIELSTPKLLNKNSTIFVRYEIKCNAMWVRSGDFTAKIYIKEEDDTSSTDIEFDNVDPNNKF